MCKLRFVAVVLVLTGMPELTWAQQVSDQSVTVADLSGAVIETRIVSVQQIRKEGKEFSQRVQNDLKLRIGSDGRLKATVQATVYQAQRTLRLKPEDLSAALERPSAINVVGPGHSVWIFDNGVVTFLRTLKGGAFKREIRFARDANGITCVASEGFAREEGGGSILLVGSDGKPFTVLSAKQMTSSCRVTMNN